MDEFAHALSAFEQKEKKDRDSRGTSLSEKTIKVRFDSDDTFRKPEFSNINPRFRFTFDYNKKYN